MADKKISQLTALAAANLAPSTDVLAIVDTSATETKKIVAQDLINGVLNVASAVGIGTSSPNCKFEVKGGSAISTLGNSYTNAGLLHQYSSSILLAIGSDGTNPVFQGVNATNNTAKDITLQPLGGNLGLGVTPSAWSSAFGPVIQVKTSSGGGALTGSSADNFRMFANTFYDGAYKRIGAGYATQYEQAAGTHAWYTAATSTANSSISFTQAMTLSAAGDLAVGTTTTDPYSLGSTGKTFALNSSDASVGSIVSLSSNGTRRAYLFANSSNTVLSSYANIPLVFNTNDTERGRFSAGGYFKASNSAVYVGSAGSYHELVSDTNGTSTALITHRSGTDPVGLRVYYNSASPNGTGNLFLNCDDNAGVRATIRSNGGLANYQANDVNLSDQRVKKDVKPLGSMWAKFKALEIVTFKYKDQTHDDDNIGVIAQQVESVAPEFIDVDGFGETPEDGVPLKTVYTTDMYHAAIKALQEAMARIESLEADVAALKGAK